MALTRHPVFYILLGFFLVLSALLVAPVWSWIFSGLLLGYLGRPIHNRLLRRLRYPGLVASLTLMLLLVLLVAPLAFFAFQLVLQTRDVAQGLGSPEAQETLNSVATWTSSTIGWPEASGNLTPGQAVTEQVVPQIRAAVLAYLPDAAGFVANFVVGLMVSLFIGYYAIKDGGRLVDFVEHVLPLRTATEHRLFREVKGILDGVLLGQIATAIVMGIVAWIGFVLFGVPGALLWGFVTAVLSLLPVVGAPGGYFPAAALVAISGRPLAAVGVALWGMLIVSSVDNFIKPLVIGKKSGLHPGMALVGVFGGLVAFGFMGFIIGPVILALTVLFLRIYSEPAELPGTSADAAAPPPGAS